MTHPAIPFGPTERAALAEAWNAHPGLRHMGARTDFSDPNVVRVTISPLQPHHRGGLGTQAVNGAVIAGLCDVAVGIVGHFQSRDRRVGTAQISVQFLRPVLGESVTAVARLVKAGTNLVFSSAEIVDDKGTVCARCDGIVAVSGLPSGGEAAAL
jgi:uncharacterized protein (TIGR00369 family)